MYAKICPYTIVPICLITNLFVSQRVEQHPDPYPSSYLLLLKYQWTAMDSKKKSDKASKNPWVHNASIIIIPPKIRGSMRSCPDYLVWETAKRMILTVRAPIERMEKKKDAKIRWQFSQKHSFAIWRTGTIFLNFPLFEIIVTMAAMKPTMKIIPIARVHSDLD